MSNQVFYETQKSGLNNCQFIILSSVHRFNVLIGYLYLNILASISYFCTVLTSYDFQNLNFFQKLPKVFSLKRFPLPFGDSSDVPSFEASVLFGYASLLQAFPVSDSSDVSCFEALLLFGCTSLSLRF